MQGNASRLNGAFEIVFASVGIFFFAFYFASRPNFKLWLYGIAAITLLILWILARTLRRKPYETSLGSLLITTIITTIVLYSVLFFMTSGITAPLEVVWHGLTIAINVVLTFLAFGTLLVVSFTLGHLILRPLRIPATPYDFFIKIALGQAAIIFIYYLLTLYNLLNLGPLLVLFTLCGGLWYFRKNIITLATRKVMIRSQSVSGESRGYPRIAVWLLIALMSLLIFSPFNVESFDLDDTRSYLNIPTTYLNHNGMVPFRFDQVNQAPFISSYILIPILQFFRPAASLLNIFFLIMTACLVYLFVRQHLSQRAALIAAGLLFTLTDNISTIQSARPDGLLIFFATLAVIVLYDQSKHRRKLTALSGVFIGLAVAVKYNALLVLPALAILLLMQKSSRREKCIEGILLGTFALLAFSPWGIRNYLLFRNPLYPVDPFARSPLTIGIPAPPVDTTGAEAQRRFLQGYTDEFVQVNLKVHPSDGVVKKLITMSLAPRGWGSNKVGPLILLSLVALLLSRPNRFVMTVAAMFAIGFIVWHILDINVMHYIVPLLVWPGVVLAAYLAGCKRQGIAYGTVFLIAMIFLTNYGMLFFVHNASFHLARYDLYRPLQERWLVRWAYLQKGRLINSLQLKHPEYVVMPFSELNQMAVADNDTHLYPNFGHFAWAGFIAGNPKPETIVYRMKKAGITHILVSPKEFADLDGYYEAVCTRLIRCPYFTYLSQKKQELIAYLQPIRESLFATIYALP